MWEILKQNNIPYYGDFNDNVNAITMERRLHEIYVRDSVKDYNIVAIDAAVTDENEKVNKVVFSNRGVNPGAGLGKRFPMIGDHSILLFTLNRTDLKKTMSYYRKGLSIGKKKDLSNIDVIYEQAKIITDIIIEVYNEVCKVSI